MADFRRSVFEVAKKRNGGGNDCVECPFFKSSTPNFIACESALTANGAVKHFFRSREEKAEFALNNCCKDKGEGCVYYNAIMLRYEQE